jgi:hypothetical protein
LSTKLMLIQRVAEDELVLCCVISSYIRLGARHKFHLWRLKNPALDRSPTKPVCRRHPGLGLAQVLLILQELLLRHILERFGG